MPDSREKLLGKSVLPPCSLPPPGARRDAPSPRAFRPAPTADGALPAAFRRSNSGLVADRPNPGLGLRRPPCVEYPNSGAGWELEARLCLSGPVPIAGPAAPPLAANGSSRHVGRRRRRCGAYRPLSPWCACAVARRPAHVLLRVRRSWLRC